jgi:hypothetical protein
VYEAGHKFPAKGAKMNVLKLTLVAATFSVGLAASASAMPVGKIDTGATSQVDQVRLVCNRFGHCWHVYGGGYGWRGGYGGGWRGGYRGRGRHWR